MRASALSMISPMLRMVALLTMLTPVSSAGVSAASPDAKPAEARAGDAGAARAEVDCALPARIDRLSGQVTMLGARQIVQVAPEECRERGGEVVSDGSQAEPPAAESTD